MNKSVVRDSWFVGRDSCPEQSALPLDDEADAVDLRLIFERSDLARRPQWTFERAMKCQAIRICIERTAQAVAKARARKQRRAAHQVEQRATSNESLVTE